MMIFCKRIEKTYYNILRGELDIEKLLNTLDKIRLSRHNVLYGGIFITEEEAEFVVKFAKE